MTHSDEIKGFTKISVWIQEGLVLLACFFYLAYRIHAGLSVEAQNPVFLFASDFWHEFLRIPGGITDWLALFFMQFWFSDLGSALFLIICFWLVAFLTRKWIEIHTESRPIHTWHLIPVAILISLHSQYAFHLGITLALIINLAVLILFLRWAPKAQGFRSLVAVAVSALLYWITGGAFMIFAILCALDDLFFRKKFTGSLVLLLIAALLPVAAASSFFIVSLKSAYWHNLVFENPTKFWFTNYGLYAFYVIALIIFLMMQSGGVRKFWQKSIGAIKLAYVWKWAVGTLLVLAGAGVLAQESNDSTIRLVLQVNRSAREGRWTEILAAVRPYAQVNPLLSFQTNLALFQTNTLLDSMFNYPQNEGTVGLLMDRKWCTAWPEEVSNLCWKLGLVNGSVHWAHEALEYKGAMPEILKRLGMAYMVKGENEAANHFFLSLKNIPFHAQIARDLLRLNNNHEELIQTGVYKHIQTCAPVEDVITLGRPSNADLELLLKTYPKNRMAFEYLMAYYLLNGNLKEIVNHISSFNALAYLLFPRHIQEALLLAATVNPKLDQSQLKKWIDPVVAGRYQEYMRILAKYSGKKEMARSSLQLQFSDTYWFYLMYVKPPSQQTENPDEFQ
jgi:hypothetical protein